jgi:putative NADPH-quinone reductase
MARKIVIIDGHPDSSPERLCHALATAYAEGAIKNNHQVRRIDVANLDIPILRTKAEFENGPIPAGVESAQESIRWADHIVIVYPLWLGTMPALLKAFLEQAIRPGFAFEAGSKGWPKKLLANRSARVVITMGMPALWYRWYFLAHSLRSLERNILKFCGISPIRESIFGMVEAVPDARRDAWINKMSALGHAGD